MAKSGRPTSGFIRGLCGLMCLIGALAGAWPVEASDEVPGSWRVVSLPRTGPIQMPLPPLAVVTEEHESGETWRQAGGLSGTLELARKEFELAFRSRGWIPDKVIPLGKRYYRSELSIWTRRHQRVLLMIWEKDVGACAFAWGEET